MVISSGIEPRRERIEIRESFRNSEEGKEEKREIE